MREVNKFEDLCIQRVDFIKNMRQEQKAEQVIQNDLRKSFACTKHNHFNKTEKEDLRKYREYLNKPQDVTDAEFVKKMKEFNHHQKYQKSKDIKL